VARHSKLPGVPHSPGRQKTTCVGCKFAAVEAVAGAVGSGMWLYSCEGWGVVGRSDYEK